MLHVMAVLAIIACLTSARAQGVVEVFSMDNDHGHAKGSGVELHRPDGTGIYVNPAAIAFVRLPLPKESGNAVIIFASGAIQSTQETVAEIIEQIELDRPEK